MVPRFPNKYVWSLSKTFQSWVAKLKPFRDVLQDFPRPNHRLKTEFVLAIIHRCFGSLGNGFKTMIPIDTIFAYICSG